MIFSKSIFYPNNNQIVSGNLCFLLLTVLNRSHLSLWLLSEFWVFYVSFSKSVVNRRGSFSNLANHLFFNFFQKKRRMFASSGALVLTNPTTTVFEICNSEQPIIQPEKLVPLKINS